ncbi:hypothetical protein BaRGS_00031700 [Batillaria attramentaria]|uniref:Uncharacterized protein n=1 Tax=Batillaria attramentaria TaxID=370345 RepID=A0ABD0JPP7_9CAEN
MSCSIFFNIVRGHATPKVPYFVPASAFYFIPGGLSYVLEGPNVFVFAVQGFKVIVALAHARQTNQDVHQPHTPKQPARPAKLQTRAAVAEVSFY